MKKLMPSLKNSGILKYLRELSIVIIGVLTTLAITQIITQNSKQKEVKEIMGLIKTELMTI